MDESGSSPDEYLVEELKKAGLLKTTRKRKTKKLKKKPAKKKNKVDIVDSPNKVAVPSLCAKQDAAAVKLGTEMQSEDIVDIPNKAAVPSLCAKQDAAAVKLGTEMQSEDTGIDSPNKVAVPSLCAKQDLAAVKLGTETQSEDIVDSPNKVAVPSLCAKQDAAAVKLGTEMQSEDTGIDSPNKVAVPSLCAKQDLAAVKLGTETQSEDTVDSPNKVAIPFLCAKQDAAAVKLGTETQTEDIVDSLKTLAIPSLCAKQDADLDTFDLESMPIIEKVGDEYIMISVDNELHDDTVPLLQPAPCFEITSKNNDEPVASLDGSLTSTPSLSPSLLVDHISPASCETSIALPLPSNVIADSITVNSTTLDDSPYHGDITKNNKRKSKVSSDPKLWQRNDSKVKREKGESYLGYRREKNPNGTNFKIKQDVFKPARSMKPPCTSSFCIKSKLRACDNVSQDAREKLFNNFWKKMSWEQRRSYICSHVTKTEKKVTKNPNSQRTESRAYYFTIEHKKYQVCKNMFLNTFGIKEWFVRYWLEKTDCAMPPGTQESGRKNGPEKTDSKNYAIEFLTKLTKMPSHYCRGSTSKLYLEPIFGTMNELYKVYKDACEVDSQASLSRKQFCIIFEKQNLALFQPKKDQCDLCCAFKVGNVSEQEYNEHITRKSRARAEKTTDKLFAQSEICHVFTQDVQSVKLLPFLNASAIYYKTKLCIHNFTIYNLANQEVFCYWFDESNSTLEASVFASCLVDYISKVLDEKSLPVVLYSDGCCAQNRNAILSNALLHLAIEKNVVITQKYLEKGHTQMECDSVHSAIECKVKGKEIFLPEQYVQLTKKARMRPMPYDSRLLDYSFFTDFSKNLIYKSIRPGKKAGDPVVMNLRVLEHGPDGIIQFKTCFDEELKPLPTKPIPLHRIKPINELPKLFAGRLPITNRKYQDLQDLKSVIPHSCHAFYDDLPHKN